jgi:FKBP-type peptidyl-prolyl cis-trans isomerase 2
MIENGKKVKVNYIGKLDDGTEFDNSYRGGEPLEFNIGDGEMIEGFDRAVSQMSVGEKIKIVLSPSEAYGFVEPGGFVGVPKTDFPEDFNPSVGELVEGQDENGNQIAAIVQQIVGDVFILNMNHPLAGKNLHFEIELISVD